MKREAEERTLHRMAKAHNLLDMWQGSQNLHATEGKSCAKSEKMTAVRFIPDPEEIVKASWLLSQHDGAAVFRLPERSPLPPSLSAKGLPGGRTETLNVHLI